MCGINGIWSKSASNYKQKVAVMNAAMKHRGPDDSGVFYSSQMTMGHQRLSIVDLSDAGHQPFLDPTGRYAMVFNGELYNFKDVRAKLTDVDFKSDTDTEVLLHAFIKYGADCLEMFNGMFAFAIWDNHTNKLFLARDRMGIKPLYYYKTDDTLVFSSEIRSLLASGLVKRKLNTGALADYLRYQTVQTPDTLVENVFMLESGCFVEFESDFKVTRYWDPLKVQANEEESYENSCKQVRLKLTEAIERRMMADVPLGAFLSGGIDSSIIVGLMSELTDDPVNTFSVVFNEKEYSEKEYSDMIAGKFKTKHNPIFLDPKDFLTDLPNALSATDHPSGDGPNTYTVSRVTKEHGITVALSGLGGDEFFAGYDVFNRCMDLSNYDAMNKLPKSLRRGLGAVYAGMKGTVAARKKAEVLGLPKIDLYDFYPVNRKVLLDDQIKKVLVDSSKVTENSLGPIIDRLKKEGSHLPLYSKVSFLEMNSYMQTVLLRDVDQMSMASALEVRVPFLDHELVETAMAISDRSKTPTFPKKLLVDSVGDLLPHDVVHRKKMGFVFPWETWMRNELKSFCEARINGLSERRYMDTQGVKQLWAHFIDGRAEVTWSRLWPLIVLENWLQENEIE